MNKIVLLNMTAVLIAVLNISLAANAADIVYPKSNNVTINAPRTFFIGSVSPDKELTINGEKVDIHQSGGFWHTVELQDGENTFKIENGTETQIYNITKEVKSTEQAQPVKEIKYDKPVTVQTNSDNVPLRSTPVDFGINRLQHFQNGMKFSAVGEYGEFYKIQLGRDDYAWISKNSVSEIKDFTIQPAKIESFTYKEESGRRIFGLKLNRKTPYVLSDNNGLDLVVYNVEDYPYNKYEFHINNTGKPLGFKSYYKDDNELVIEVKNYMPQGDKTLPLKGLKITVDPGHGGAESGAIGCLGDKEKDINLSISAILAEKLKSAGAEVYMTRNDDSEVSLSDRVKLSNEFGADIFISIHNNALPDSLADKKSSGSEIYYFYPQSRELAKTVLNSLSTETGLKNNGAKQQSFAVVRNTQSLSILVEAAYIINPDDNAKLLDENFQNTIAESILHGLEKYFNEAK